MLLYENLIAVSYLLAAHARELLPLKFSVANICYSAQTHILMGLSNPTEHQTGVSGKMGFTGARPCVVWCRQVTVRLRGQFPAGITNRCPS